jgi:hypothetical protein
MTEGSGRELDNEQFVRIIDQLAREHGHQSFYTIEQNGTIYDMLHEQHICIVDNVIVSRNHHSGSTMTNTSNYDSCETDNFFMKILVVESRLTEKMKDEIHTHYDHDHNFYDYPGHVFFYDGIEHLQCISII